MEANVWHTILVSEITEINIVYRQKLSIITHKAHYEQNDIHCLLQKWHQTNETPTASYTLNDNLVKIQTDEMTI